MGKRVSEKVWQLFLKANPDAKNDLVSFNVKFDRQNIFPNFSRYSKKDLSKSNIERYGIELGPALDWLDENTNDEYYADIDRDVGGHRIVEVTFYFYDEGDAMAFKLIMAEKT